jgi:hypothetical protein
VGLGLHAGDGCDLLWVGFDASFGDDEPQEHASGHPEDTLLGIELDAFRLETSECHFKVGEEVGSLPRLDYDVIDVCLCDRTSQVIRPTYSCPCLTDIRHPVDVPKSLDKLGIFPYLTRNVSPVLQTLQNIGDKEMRKQLHKLTFISKASLSYFITDQTKSECRVVILYKPGEAQTPPEKF